MIKKILFSLLIHHIIKWKGRNLFDNIKYKKKKNQIFCYNYYNKL